MTQLALKLGEREVEVAIDTLIVAGWTGRDRAAVERHIAELAELGVPRPSSVPVFYRVPAARLTTTARIQSTAASSGEVEPVLLRHDGRLWVGVGSDHTDRDVETYGVAVAKQLCEKPIAREFWPYEDLVGGWDQLVISSWIDDDTQYQDGSLAGLMHPDQLLAIASPPLADGTLMFCGTLAAIGGIRPATLFRYELKDPATGRRVSSGYEVETLPLVS